MRHASFPVVAMLTLIGGFIAVLQRETSRNSEITKSHLPKNFWTRHMYLLHDDAYAMPAFAVKLAL